MITLADEDLIKACVEIANYATFLEVAEDVTLEYLTTEQHALMEQTQEFAENRLVRLCGALRTSILREKA